MISEYSIRANSTIRKAAAPIIGGMICPPVDAAASTAPANVGVKPSRFIIGIVSTPVDATFAVALPFTVPIKLLATTATLALPPRLVPATARAKSIKNSATPKRFKNAPKMMNRNMNSRVTLNATPRIPPIDKYKSVSTLSKPKVEVFKTPGK